MRRLRLLALGCVVALTFTLSFPLLSQYDNALFAGVSNQTDPTAASVQVNRDANLRSGPGTSFDVVGVVSEGDVLALVAQNAAGDWYRLQSGEWIAAFLVSEVTIQLPIAASDTAPAATAVPVEEPTAAPAEEAPAPTAAPAEEATAAPAEEPTAAPAEEPTAAPAEEPTAAPAEEAPAQQSPTGAFVNRNANLRAGPGTNYDRIGRAPSRNRRRRTGNKRRGRLVSVSHWRMDCRLPCDQCANWPARH